MGSVSAGSFRYIFSQIDLNQVANMELWENR